MIHPHRLTLGGSATFSGLMNVLRILALLLILPLPGVAADIAVTFDDLPVSTALRDPLARQQAITKKLVGDLRAAEIPAVGFVNGNKLVVDGKVDPKRVALLDHWLDAGLELGNHTFAHQDLHRVGLDAFRDDVLEGEASVRPLLAKRGLKLRWFRHPFLHTGRSLEDREAVLALLDARGVRVAPVTIDNSDWIFARAFDAPAADEGDTRTRLVEEYVRYMIAKVEYYDAQSKRLFDRSIPQVLLVHASALNAEAFGTLARRLREQGHRFVTLDRALEDEAYRSPDGYTGPAGLSWLDRWALTRGVPKGFFSAEPRTADWVLELAGVDSE